MYKVKKECKVQSNLCYYFKIEDDLADSLYYAYSMGPGQQQQQSSTDPGPQDDRLIMGCSWVPGYGPTMDKRTIKTTNPTLSVKRTSYYVL
jgi:hypothetical protein